VESAAKEKPLNIFIVSDATGSTAEAVLTSVLVQFGTVQPLIRRFPFIRTREQVEDIIQRAPAGNCIIIFTFVSPELCKLMLEGGREKKLIVVDLISPLMTIISGILQSAPSMKPGKLNNEGEDAFKVTKAIHYTLQHDDGQGLETLEEADLIILGVSRTGKTPTSIFLSCRNLRIANIPIIKDLPLPEKVIQLPIKKVGFRIDIERLLQLRSERARSLRLSAIPGYSGLESIFAELEYCEELYKRIPRLRTIDVTNRSIEEISQWITHHVL